MSHVDEDTIALLALGESVSARDNDHVRSCVSCQAKVDQLAAIVHSARAVTDEDKPVAPPDELWIGSPWRSIPANRSVSRRAPRVAPGWAGSLWPPRSVFWQGARALRW